MATPAQYDTAGLIERGSLWFKCLAGNTALSVTATKALDGRKYHGAKDGKDKVVVPNHHEQGLALFASFQSSGTARATAVPTRKKQSDATTKLGKDLRQWASDIHRELLEIKRNSSTADLNALPALEELSSVGGLRSSASNLIAFISNPQLQTTLGQYGIGDADGKHGQALFDAWAQSRSDVTVVRGGETGATKANMTDREAFAAWLGIWWGIAKVRLKDHPDVLEALGVERGKVNGGRGGGGSGGAGVPAGGEGVPV